MKSNNLLVYLAFAVVAVAMFNLSVSFIKISDFNEKVTGLASGYVNLTVNTQISIAMHNDTIEWGGGVVNTDSGYSFANLTTHAFQNGTVDAGGNWTNNSNSALGIVVENTGSVNASLTITSENDSEHFIGGTGPIFRWNVTDKEAGTCNNGSHDALSTWTDANTGGLKFCEEMGYLIGADEIYLDVWLGIPVDANRTGVAIGNQLTFTADTAG